MTKLRENKSAAVFPTWKARDTEDEHTSKCFSGFCSSCEENIFDLADSIVLANLGTNSKVEWSTWSLSSNDKLSKDQQSDESARKQAAVTSRSSKASASHNQAKHNPLRRFSSTLINDEQDQIEELFTPQIEKKNKCLVGNAKQKDATSRAVSVSKQSNKQYKFFN